MKHIREEIYIKKRKVIAFIYALFFKILGLFPINERKICFSAFEGGGYCCNPKYIAEELHRRSLEVEMVWLVKDLKKEFPDYIKPVKDNWMNRAYHMSTAKIWVDNSRQKYGTKKRKNQFYIQTWHGQIGFKPIGRLRGEKFSQIGDIVSQYDAKLIDIWLSNSAWSTRTFQNAFYGEPIQETGSPRNDIFWKKNSTIRKKICEKYKIDAKSKIVLYAPTFRGGSQLTKRSVNDNLFSIDFDKVLQTLEERDGQKWIILVRLHPQVALTLTEPKYSNLKNLVDVTLYDDMYELISICDLFITDYSSAAFDAAIAKKDVLLYADDIMSYMDDRGELLWDVDQMPFQMCINEKQLLENIVHWNEKAYQSHIEKLMQELGVIEDGHASERVVDEMIKRLDW